MAVFVATHVSVSDGPIRDFPQDNVRFERSSQGGFFLFVPHLGRKFGNLIETMIDRIDTDAVGYFGKLGEIFRYLFPRHLRRRRR